MNQFLSKMAAVSTETTNFPKLGSPPIAEAVIDFRVRLEKKIEVESLLKFEERVKGKYTLRDKTREAHVALPVGNEDRPQSSISSRVIGYNFESTNKEYVIQLGLEGLTISRLPHYTTWEDFLNEAKVIWGHFSKIVGSVTITRSALRYINRLELPGPSVDFDEYLTAPPQIPPGLPQHLVEFISRNIIPVEEAKAAIILTQAFRPVFTGNVLPVILDIDVFSEREINAIDGQQWEVLETLRILKNRAFFNSITPKTLELFL